MSKQVWHQINQQWGNNNYQCHTVRSTKNLSQQRARTRTSTPSKFEAFAIWPVCGNTPKLLSDRFHTFREHFNSSILPLSQCGGMVEGRTNIPKLRLAAVGCRQCTGLVAIIVREKGGSESSSNTSTGSWMLSASFSLVPQTRLALITLLIQTNDPKVRAKYLF